MLYAIQKYCLEKKLHFITLHHIILLHITLHFITLHHISLHYITLHYVALRYITSHHTANANQIYTYKTLEHKRLVTDLPMHLLQYYLWAFCSPKVRIPFCFTLSIFKWSLKKLEMPLCKNNLSKHFFSSRVSKP